MLVRISNLPTDCNEDDILVLLDSLPEIETIELTLSGNPDNRLARVCIQCSRAGADGIARKIDGRFWKNRHIIATVALFAYR
jgi:hypothetical protein